MCIRALFTGGCVTTSGERSREKSSPSWAYLTVPGPSPRVNKRRRHRSSCWTCTTRWRPRKRTRYWGRRSLGKRVKAPLWFHMDSRARRSSRTARRPWPARARLWPPRKTPTFSMTRTWWWALSIWVRIVELQGLLLKCMCKFLYVWNMNICGIISHLSNLNRRKRLLYMYPFYLSLYIEALFIIMTLFLFGATLYNIYIYIYIYIIVYKRRLHIRSLCQSENVIHCVCSCFISGVSEIAYRICFLFLRENVRLLCIFSFYEVTKIKKYHCDALTRLCVWAKGPQTSEHVQFELKICARYRRIDYSLAPAFKW